MSLCREGPAYASASPTLFDGNLGAGLVMVIGMKRQGLRPRLMFGTVRSGRSPGLREVLPFQRSWVAIVALVVFDLAFLVPAVLTFGQAAAAWSRLGSLFDLVSAVFLSAWLLGWLLAPIVITGILILMLWGREVLQARQGVVELWMGVPGVGCAAVYDAAKIRNLRLETPEKNSGHSWRGPHLVFDYGANAVRFGSNLGLADAGRVESRIETATGVRIRRGPAAPEDLEAPWEPQASSAQLAVPGASARTKNTWAQPGHLSTSALALLLANLVPLGGTLWLGWQLSDVMVLYWAESAIIGFFNVCKIIVIGRWFALLAGPFFLGHFGGFMAIHFLFIYTLFVKGIHGGDSGGNLAEVAQLFASLWPALAALFISHAVSFVINFIGRREYHSRSIGDQMSEPYGRIIAMHLVLLFGGFLALLFGSPTPVLLLVIAFKVGFDLRAHRKQRLQRKSPSPAGAATA